MGIYSGLAIVSLYIFGIWWCCVVIRRLRDDIKEIRELKQPARTAAIVIIWLLTIPIAIVLTTHATTAIRELAAWARLIA